MLESNLLKGVLGETRLNECREARDRIRRDSGLDLSLREVAEFKGMSLEATVHPFGPYRIECKLGQGGMGVVYLARRQEDGVRFAIKILSPRLEDSSECHQRFRREASMMVRLSHPNIVKGHEFGVIDGRTYLAMEHVDGMLLLDLIEAAGKLPEEAVRDLAVQVARALEAIELEGLVHRDVNPTNIMVDRRGTVKLMDFGLVQSTRGDLKSLTRLGQVRGTAYYMSPEQIRESESIDIRSDMYSLGATLYHLLTGNPPFLGETPSKVLNKHLRQQARPLDVSVGQPLASAVFRMLRKRRDLRWRTAAEMLRDLEAIPACGGDALRKACERAAD